MENPSITELLLKNEKEYADRVYLRQPFQDVWTELTWSQVMNKARRVAQFLYDQGFKKGDKFSIYSKNCAEWFITDFGLTLAGMINVPLFGNQHPDSIKYILEHAEIKMVFVGKLDDHQHARKNIPEHMKTAGFDYHPDLNVDFTFEDMMKADPIQEVIMPEANDMYTIIYTSGTSGNPKGAVYNHDRIANYLEVVGRDVLILTPVRYHHFVSYLPLAHVYERSAVEMISLTVPCDVSFVESLDKFADNLQEIQPTMFTAVPRIWGVFQQKIEHKLPPKKMNILLKIPLISSLIKKKVKSGLGFERCKNFVSGASHLPVSIIEFFDKLDIQIQEGYGQTENLAYVTLNPLDNRCIGYVGTPRTEVALDMGEEGELLTKTNCLMNGYYKEPKKSKEQFDERGYLRTGDIAQLDENQNVKILGRLSENFKNQKGEFIAPTPIETEFSSNALVDQLCLVGRGLPSNVMVVTLAQTVHPRNKDKFANYLKETMHKVNAKLASYEKISHVFVCKDVWTPENGFLTPTLKVKRPAVEEAHQSILERAVEQRNQVVWETELVAAEV